MNINLNSIKIHEIPDFFFLILCLLNEIFLGNYFDVFCYM